MSGLEVIRRIHHSPTQTQVVVLSMHARRGVCPGGSKICAKGYVLKGFRCEGAGAGNSPGKTWTTLSKPVAGSILYRSPPSDDTKPEAGPLETLTNREREVLPLVASA